MLFAPEEHAANPPATWTVARVGRRWELRTQAGSVLQSFATKHEAEAARHTGFFADLYADEGKWFAGERVRNWKPYAQTAK